MSESVTNENESEPFNPYTVISFPAPGTWKPWVYIESGGKVTIKDDLTVEELREVISRMGEYIYRRSSFAK